jgi:hypothetical protein
MSLLLAPDYVALYTPPGTADEHGWALADAAAEPDWAGQGSLQRAPGRSDDAAGQGGGHGPRDPAASALAVIFLPTDAPVADGTIAEVGGQWWALSQTRLVGDPRGTGDLDCWAATATQTDRFGGV